ncbi:MAG: dihydropteridine reductase [Clostridia bacterium]|nr:dihydropteridine reductase [Clostridia bacterium]
MNTNDQNFIIQKIRTQYTEKQHTQLDALKELDAKVKRPANIFAYIFGSIGAIVMGCGMSLVMTDIGTTLGMANTMLPGIAIGVVGLTIALINYPIYNGILSSRRKKYAKDIIALSDKIMNN